MQVKVIAESASGFTRHLLLVGDHHDDVTNDDRYPIKIERLKDGGIELTIDLHKHELARRTTYLHVSVRP